MKTFKDGIRTSKERVENLLTDLPVTRDSDVDLYLAYLVRHHELRDVIGWSGIQALRYIMHTAPPPETIRRTRQLIQAEREDLRGNHREARLAKAVQIQSLLREVIEE